MRPSRCSGTTGFAWWWWALSPGTTHILTNIKKGVRVERARQFAKDCHDLGIIMHGTFIVGLPGETTETIRETIKFARDVNPHTIQVSIAAPYPGTALYRQAQEEGWLSPDDANLVDEHGVQTAALSYPNLNRTEIFDSVDTFYRKFYFRAGKIAEMSAEMIRDGDVMKRRLREGSGVRQLPPQTSSTRLASAALGTRRWWSGYDPSPRGPRRPRPIGRPARLEGATNVGLAG